MLLRRAAVLLCSTFYILQACSFSAGAQADPKQVLNDASTALARVKTAAVELKFGSGASLAGFSVVSASGKVKLPGDSDTTIKARQSSDSLIELEVVTLQDHVYLKLPFLGWSDLTGQTTAIPSVGAMFDPQKGLPAVMPKGRSLSTQGSETVDGKDCWKIAAVYTATQVAQAIQPLSPAGDIQTTLWVGKNDHLLRKAFLRGALFQAGKNTSLEVRLHNFNANFDIVKPPIQ